MLIFLYFVRCQDLKDKVEGFATRVARLSKKSDSLHSVRVEHLPEAIVTLTVMQFRLSLYESSGYVYYRVLFK